MLALCRRSATLLVASSLALLFGFDWPGRAAQLDRELQVGDESQRREAVRQLAHTQGDVAGPLLRALEDDDLEVRLEAARAAAKLGIQRAVPLLLDWLDEDEPALRASAAEALGSLGELRALEALVRTLGDARAPVRAAAVKGLAALGSTDAVEPLLSHLGEPDSSVRAQIIFALGALGDGRAVPALMGLPEDDQPELVIASMRALGQLGDSQALTSLLNGLAHSQQSVRVAACQALGELGVAQAYEPLAGAVRGPDPLTAQAALAALTHLPAADGRPDALAVELLGDASLNTAALTLLETRARQQAVSRQDAHQAAQNAGPSGPVEALVQALDRDRSVDNAERLAPALYRLAGVTDIAPALPRLFEALSSAESGHVALAVGRSGDARALVPLLELLERWPVAELGPVLQALSLLLARMPPDGQAADPLLDLLPKVTGSARAQVVALIGRTGAARALPTLRPLIESPELPLRLAAVRALGELADSDSGDALIARIEDLGEPPQLRHAAAIALGQCATASHVLRLLRGVLDPGPRDRHAMLRALARALPRLAQEKALPPKLSTTLIARLAPLLSHPDGRLAAAVFDVLSAWHPPEALRPMAALFRHPSPRRRARAALAMGAYPAADSRPVLRHVLRLSTTRTLVSAVVALGEVGDERDLTALLKLMDRKHWPVPGAVMYAVARMAERGVLKPFSTQRALCEFGGRREPLVRANLATAMARLGVGPCRDGLDPRDWLGREQVQPVRLAALRWLQVARHHGKLKAAEVDRFLRRCVVREPDPVIARACEGLPAREGEPGPLEVFAYDRDGRELLEDRLVAVRFDDGLLYLGHTDENGRLGLPHAPAVAAELTDPGSWPLAPIAGHGADGSAQAEDAGGQDSDRDAGGAGAGGAGRPHDG